MIVKGKNIYKKAEQDLYIIKNCLNSNNIYLNLEKTEYVDFSPDIYYDTIQIHTCLGLENSFLHANCNCFKLRRVDNYNYLRCIIDKDLNFDLHIKSIHKLINKYGNALHICTSKRSKNLYFLHLLAPI